MRIGGRVLATSTTTYSNRSGTKLRRALGIWGLWCAAFAPVACGGETGCPRVLEASQVLNDGRALDGKVVCVRGMLLPVVVPQWESTSLIYELLPRRREKSARAGRALGMIEWSPEMGIEESLYKPDSFGILDRAKPGAGSSAPVDVTIRAMVEYKKNLFARLPPAIPESPQTEAMRGSRYKVELVVLEIVKVEGVQ